MGNQEPINATSLTDCIGWSSLPFVNAASMYLEPLYTHILQDHDVWQFMFALFEVKI